MFESILSLSPAQLARQFPGEHPRDIRLAALMGRSLARAGARTTPDRESAEQTVPVSRNLTQEIREAERRPGPEPSRQQPHLTASSGGTAPLHRNIIDELKGGAR